MNRPAASLVIALICWLASCAPAFGQQTDTPQKVQVSPGFLNEALDGDTLQVKLDNGELVTVRLVDVDAPESTQPYGLDAKNKLREKLLERPIQVQWTERDRYERVLGRVFIVEDDGEQKRCLNEELVREGWAWRFDKYSKDEKLGKLQAEAKSAKKGLWAGEQPISPWDWRNGKREDGESVASAEDSIAVYVTETGTKYHRDGCLHLRKSKQEISLKNARSAYEPCQTCKPPK